MPHVRMSAAERDAYRGIRDALEMPAPAGKGVEVAKARKAKEKAIDAALEAMLDAAQAELDAKRR